jgi:hypothetical protein
MTLTEAQTLVRLYSRLSTCTISTTELNLYIARAELKTALDFLELNPGTASKTDKFTWVGGAFAHTLDSTLLTNLGLNRTVHKVVVFGEGAPDASLTGGIGSWTLWSPGEVQELAGDSAPRPLRDNTGTTYRWFFTGDGLAVYPIIRQATQCVIQYTRTPKLASTGADELLQDFSTSMQQFDELVVLRATEAMLRDRGMDGSWIQAQIAEYEERVNSHARTFQMQETPAMVGVRYRTKSAV